MKSKKGDVWISAVLYMALGVIVLTIVLAAGVPMIQKMKDKNSFSQAKTVFYTVNENMKEVINEGPGSRRFLSPFEIKTGEFDIDTTNNQVIWSMKTKAKMMEPSYYFTAKPMVDDPRCLSECRQCTSIPCFREGDLYLFAQETNIVDEYIANLKLSYNGIAQLQLDSVFTGPFAGSYSFTIKHTGTYNDPGDALCPNCPKIELKIAP
ncbi:MAG: hypothetical protein QME12_03685 [Nanoarchaeota archaeon]|nr:hypothetical protein [Nanoarchaeota archaeon]